MGRAERRKRERYERIEERKGKILLSPKDLNDIKKEIASDATKFKTEWLMTCFALALNRKFGFGPTRIARALREIDNMMLDILEDKHTIDDFIQELETKTGIEVKCDD